MRNKVEKLLAAKGQSFEKEVIYRASQAAGELRFNTMQELAQF